MSEWEVVQPGSEWEAEEQNPSVEQKESPWMSALNGAYKYTQDVTHGALQPALESGYLGERVANASRGVAKSRNDVFNRSEEQNPFAANAGKIIPEIYTDIAATYATGAASKALNIGNSKFAGYLNNILGPRAGKAIADSTILHSIFGSGAIGAAKYTNEDDSRLRNSVTEGGLSGLAASLIPLGKYGKKAFNAFPVDKLAERIAKTDKEAARQVVTKGYDKFFQESDKVGADLLKPLKSDTKRIIRNTSKSEAKALKEFASDPTIENAKKATTKLDSTISRLEKLKATKGLTDAKSLALREAKTAKKELSTSLSRRVGVSEQRAALIYKHTTESESDALKAFIDSPTIKNAHEADKDLGKAFRRLEKINAASGLSGSKLKAFQEIGKVRKQLSQSIDKRFVEKGAPELVGEYGAMKKDWLNNYEPFKNPKISAYLKGELTGKDLISGLNKDKKFTAKFGEKYPEIHINQNILKYLAGAGAVGAAATYGPGIIKELF